MEEKNGKTVQESVGEVDEEIWLRVKWEKLDFCGISVLRKWFKNMVCIWDTTNWADTREEEIWCRYEGGRNSDTDISADIYTFLQWSLECGRRISYSLTMNFIV